MAATEVVQKLPVSPQPQTPPSSPRLSSYRQTLDSGHVQLFVDLLKAAQAIQSAQAAGPVQLTKNGETSGDKNSSRARASKVEFKTVNEV